MSSESSESKSRAGIDQAELENRKEAVGRQIEALKELNRRFKKGFTQLHEAILYGRKEKLLTPEEAQRFNEINDCANKAKHRGLAAPGAQEEERRIAASSMKPRDDDVELITITDADLGYMEFQDGTDYISQLQTAYSTYLGRSVVKNEPSYRGLANKPPFQARIRFVSQELAKPFEIIGDKYSTKQEAKQSAAFHALCYLPKLPKAMHGSSGHPGNTQSNDLNDASNDLSESASITIESTSGSLPTDGTVVRVMREKNAQLTLKDIYMLSMGANAKLTPGINTQFQKQLTILSNEKNIIRPVKGGKWELVSNLSAPEGAIAENSIGSDAEQCLPSNDAILGALRERKTAMSLKELYRVSSRSGSEKLTPDINTKFQKLLTDLAKKHVIRAVGDKWELVTSSGTNYGADSVGNDLPSPDTILQVLREQRVGLTLKELFSLAVRSESGTDVKLTPDLNTRFQKLLADLANKKSLIRPMSDKWVLIS